MTWNGSSRNPKLSISNVDYHAKHFPSLQKNDMKFTHICTVLLPSSIFRLLKDKNLNFKDTEIIRVGIFPAFVIFPTFYDTSQKVSDRFCVYRVIGRDLYFPSNWSGNITSAGKSANPGTILRNYDDVPYWQACMIASIYIQSMLTAVAWNLNKLGEFFCNNSARRIYFILQPQIHLS